MDVKYDVIEVRVRVVCVCGEPLRQLKGDVGTITVSPCHVCQNEAIVQAYNKGLENGRKSKD